MNSINSDSDPEILKAFSASRSRARRLRFWTILCLSASVIAFAVYNLLPGNGSEAVQYKTLPAVLGNLSVTVTATGSLAPTNQVDVGCELSGTIRYVDVNYNDWVKKGQVLARMDTSKLQAQVVQSKASLESAQAKVLQAQATVKETKAELARLNHLRELSSSKAVSRHDLDAAEAALARSVADEANCKAEVSRTKGLLEADETDLAKSIIRSPINGIVLTRSVEPGQTVAAAMSTPVLFTLAEDLAKMELQLDVDEADVGEVREGQGATFTVDAYPERRFPARVQQVRYGAKTKNSVVTYKAILNVDNSELLLRPGMTATAEITVNRIENSILVPNAALRFTPPRTEKKADTQDGGIMTKIIPRPPPPEKKSEDPGASGKGKRVWMLRDGQPAAIPVVAGASDGTYTALKEGAVEADMPLLVDTVSSVKR